MAARRDPARRRAALRKGLHAEIVAAAWLIAKGYTILARRHVGGGGEIDIVARRGRTLAFVEVKARRDVASASDAIDPAKQRRFVRAVAHWTARNPWCEALDMRCDAVLVAPWRWPRHVVDAFPLEP